MNINLYGIGVGDAMKRLFIVGSGGFSKQVIEIVESINKQSKTFEIVGLIDDNTEFLGKKVLNYEVVGTTDYLSNYSRDNEIYGVIAIANGYARKAISEKLSSVTWVNLIHPKTVVTKYINMGVGNIICAGTVINPDCKIGNHCHINISNSFGHDVKLSNFTTIMPGCRISGNVTIESYSMIGTGSTVIQGINIAQKTILGAGAVVIKDTLINGKYLGVPAKKRN